MKLYLPFPIPGHGIFHCETSRHVLFCIQLSILTSFIFIVSRVFFNMSWMFVNGKCICYSHMHLGKIFWNDCMCLSYYFLFVEHNFTSQAGRYVAEDLVTGMRRSGQMSVVRRFFCLLVTFDLLFTSLLWLIVILVCILLAEAYNISLLEVNCAMPCATSCVRITVLLLCHFFNKCDVTGESSGLMVWSPWMGKRKSFHIDPNTRRLLL